MMIEVIKKNTLCNITCIIYDYEFKKIKYSEFEYCTV